MSSQESTRSNTVSMAKRLKTIEYCKEKPKLSKIEIITKVDVEA